MKRLLVLILWGWIFSFPLYAQSPAWPERTVEYVTDGIEVTYLFNTPTIRENELVTGTSFWEYTGFGISELLGRPAIPFRRDIFAIPTGYSTDINILEVEYRDTTFYMSPAIQHITGNSMAIDSISAYHGFYPEKVLSGESLQPYRDAYLQRVIITPVLYDNENHVARAYSKIKYKITINKRNNLKSPPPYNPWFDEIWGLSSIMLDRYLIVTVSEYENDIQDFVEWKGIKGNIVFVSTRDRGDWTSEAVKDSIESYFQNYGIKYLLIVGGENDVPSINRSDYYYGLPADSSQIPQIFRGRIPLNTSADIRAALEKVIMYEQNPTMDETFYQNGTHCAGFIDEERAIHFQPPRPDMLINPDGHEDECSVLISEEVRNHLEENYNKDIDYIYAAEEDVIPTNWDYIEYSNGDSIPQELLRPGFAWNGNNGNIISAINNGTSYVLYHGRGNANSWELPSFDTSDIDSLGNGNKLPIVFSMSDETGMFQAPDSVICLAEKFLKKNNGGGVAVIAPTQKISPGNSGAIVLSMFDAIWPGMQLQYGNFYLDKILCGGHLYEDPWEGSYWIEDWWNPAYSFVSSNTPVYILGQILDRSLCRLTEITSLDYGLPNEWLSYHCYGDPSMKFWATKPQKFVEPKIYISGDSLYVETLDGGCRMIFYDRATGMALRHIGNQIAYPDPSANIVVCLDRDGYVPYVWDYSKDLYIQNETILNETRTYKGRIIKIGRNVTDTRSQGDVNIQNSNITIEGQRLELHPGTSIDKNFQFHNQ